MIYTFLLTRILIVQCLKISDLIYNDFDSTMHCKPTEWPNINDFDSTISKDF